MRVCVAGKVLMLLLLQLQFAAAICTLQKLIRFAASAVILIARRAAHLMKGHRETSRHTVHCAHWAQNAIKNVKREQNA